MSGNVVSFEDSRAEELILRFITIFMDQGIVNYPTDAERRAALLTSKGLEVGRGDSLNMNCLSDSLLQCLMHHKVIQMPEDEHNETQWRRRLCASVRKHLCNYGDMRLRPRQRDERNAIRRVSEAFHATVVSEHHRHAEPILKYFIQHYGRAGIDISWFSRCGFPKV